MVNLQFHGGKLIFRDGQIAMNYLCCCDCPDCEEECPRCCSGTGFYFKITEGHFGSGSSSSSSSSPFGDCCAEIEDALVDLGAYGAGAKLDWNLGAILPSCHWGSQNQSDMVCCVEGMPSPCYAEISLGCYEDEETGELKVRAQLWLSDVTYSTDDYDCDADRNTLTMESNNSECSEVPSEIEVWPI